MTEPKRTPNLRVVNCSVKTEPKQLVLGIKRAADQGVGAYGHGFHFVDFDALTSDLLDQIQPEIVFSPLIGKDYDALDVAERLKQSGYSGQYMALSVPVPDTELIRAEVSSAVPGLEFDVLSLQVGRNVH